MRPTLEYAVCYRGTRLPAGKPIFAPTRSAALRELKRQEKDAAPAFQLRQAYAGEIIE
ncbi:MAG: hypothetical protein RJQ08_03790 [Salinisphaeraceae bacterium]